MAVRGRSARRAGNFRESELQHIVRGVRADVGVMSKPEFAISGVVDSVGFGGRF